VDVADRRAYHAAHLPRDLAVRLAGRDYDLHVGAAELGGVVQGLSVHVHDEAVAHVADQLPVGRLEHARAVDSDVTLRVAQQGEDGRGLGRYRAGDLDPLCRHAAIVCHADGWPPPVAGDPRAVDGDGPSGPRTGGLAAVDFVVQTKIALHCKVSGGRRAV